MRTIQLQQLRDNAGQEAWVYTKGQKKTKVSFIDKATGRVVEHRFYSPDGQSVIASAWPQDYRQVSVGDSSESVTLPHKLKFRLYPPREHPREGNQDMELTLKDTQVNPTLGQTQRDALFRVPEIRGYKVVYLNAPTGGTGTLPAGVNASRATRGRAPMPRTSDDLSTPSATESILGSKVPRAPTPPGSGQAWRTAAGGLDR
jgi:hypothetical protein